MVNHYHYLDWFGMALAIGGMVLLGNRDGRGFVAHLVSNVLWIVVGLWAHSLALVLGNAAFLVINARGWWKWRRTHATPEAGLP